MLDRVRVPGLRHRRRAPGLEDRVDALSGALVDLAETLRGIAAEQQRQGQWLAELRTRARRTQALGARTYEALSGWPALLAAARASEDYELAFTDADPLITVPIPTYHSADTLCNRALASVRAQTHTNWEAVVVGDACTDDTEARVLAIGDERITFHNLLVREDDPADPWERWAVKGSIPRATGIELARGRWIAPLSHDDEWDPDHLATLLAEARASRAEVVYSRMRVVNAEEPSLPVVGSVGAYPPRLGEWGWQSAMFHGGLRFLRYDRNCALASEPNDWNLARRAWETGVRFAHVPRETASLFVHDRRGEIDRTLAEMGLPPAAAAADSP